jgi:hypothetical protein
MPQIVDWSEAPPSDYLVGAGHPGHRSPLRQNLRDIQQKEMSAFRQRSYKITDMKKLKNFIAAAVILTTLAGPVVGLASTSEKDNETKAAKAKPYPLDKCIVSDEKLGGDMGDPYVFVQSGREIKLCCKSCLKDFKKDPAKYLKKIDKADKKDKK